MRKVSYKVAGETFNSYNEALKYKSVVEAIADETVDMVLELEYLPETDDEACAEHRAKVNEILHAGCSIPM